MVACYNEPFTVHAQHRVEAQQYSLQTSTHVYNTAAPLVHNVPLTFALASACLLRQPLLSRARAILRPSLPRAIAWIFTAHTSAADRAASLLVTMS